MRINKKSIIVTMITLLTLILISVIILFGSEFFDRELIPFFDDGTYLKINNSRLIDIKGTPSSSGVYESNGQFWCEYEENILNYKCNTTYDFVDTLFTKKLYNICVKINVSSENDFLQTSNVIKNKITDFYNNEDYNFDESNDYIEISVDNGEKGVLYTIEYINGECVFNITCDV